MWSRLEIVALDWLEVPSALMELFGLLKRENSDKKLNSISHELWMVSIYMAQTVHILRRIEPERFGPKIQTWHIITKIQYFHSSQFLIWINQYFSDYCLS